MIFFYYDDLFFPNGVIVLQQLVLVERLRSPNPSWRPTVPSPTM